VGSLFVGIGKAALMGGKAAVQAGKTIGSIAVKGGKAAAKVGQTVGKAVVKAEKAAVAGGKEVVKVGKTVGKAVVKAEKAAVKGGKEVVKVGKTVGSKTVATAKSAGNIALKAEKSVQHTLSTTAKSAKKTIVAAEKSVKHAMHTNSEDTSHDEAGSEDATDLVAEETDAPEKETEAPEKETEAPEKETEAPEKETDAPEKETKPRVGETSVLPGDDDMGDDDDEYMHDEHVVDISDSMHKEDKVDGKNAVHNEDEFNDFFGQGTFDQEKFDRLFSTTSHAHSGVPDPRIKILAFPPKYLQAAGITIDQVPRNYEHLFGKNPMSHAYHGASAFSSNNGASAHSINSHIAAKTGSQQGVGGEKVVKKCNCRLNEYAATPLIVRTSAARESEKPADIQLLTALRAQGFSTMKTCGCKKSKNKYICCDVCPENFSKHGDGRASCDNKQQCLMASSPVDKQKAVFGGLRHEKTVKGHSGTKSHVFWRVVAAMHRILAEILAVEIDPNVRDQQNWSQHVLVNSLWKRQHWTDANWMSCCNLLMDNNKDYQKWRQAYAEGMNGELEDKSSKIAEKFMNAQSIFTVIGERKFIVAGDLAPGTLPEGYSTTDS